MLATVSEICFYEHALSLSERNDLTGLHVDSALLILCEYHIVSGSPQSVNTDQRSRRRPYFEYPFFGAPDPVIQLIVTLPSFLISCPPAHVHVSPRLDSGVSSSLTFETRFRLVTHSTAPLSTTASSLIHLPRLVSSTTYKHD